jgi:hypothetical protein
MGSSQSFAKFELWKQLGPLYEAPLFPCFTEIQT